MKGFNRESSRIDADVKYDYEEEFSQRREGAEIAKRGAYFADCAFSLLFFDNKDKQEGVDKA